MRPLQRDGLQILEEIFLADRIFTSHRGEKGFIIASFESNYSKKKDVGGLESYLAGTHSKLLWQYFLRQEI